MTEPLNRNTWSISVVQKTSYARLYIGKKHLLFNCRLLVSWIDDQCCGILICQFRVRKGIV
eukprot:XP_001704082.1 Hypothetical protein GL50803_38128 [Giardia lamblia ATCC 50803]